MSARPAKPLRARLPWILSGLALVAFAVAISLMIGKSVGARAPGMPPTGAVITGAEGADGLDLGAVDLSTMAPREAADRLFDRALRTEAGGDTARARFFAGMGVEAYRGLPPAELDLDARFHVGLLETMRGDTSAARRTADGIIAEAPDHLLAWILRVRLAELAGDQAALAAARKHFREALDVERALDRPEYTQHANVIDAEAGS